MSVPVSSSLPSKATGRISTSLFGGKRKKQLAALAEKQRETLDLNHLDDEIDLQLEVETENDEDKDQNQEDNDASFSPPKIARLGKDASF